MTDLDLVHSVQQGDLARFELLVDRHLDPIHAFISLKLPLAHLADELTHETFVFAFRHLDQFTEGTTVRSWLMAIALNKIRAEIERFCRQERNRVSYAEYRLVEMSLPPCDLEDSNQIDALKHCLEKVPKAGQGLLALRYHDGYSTPVGFIAEHRKLDRLLQSVLAPAAHRQRVKGSILLDVSVPVGTNQNQFFRARLAP